MKIKTVEEIFESNNISQKHSDYFLQTILYSLIVDKSKALNPSALNISPALLFIKQVANEGYDPVLEIDSHKISDVGIYKKQFIDLLKNVLAEIFDPNKPFVPTEDRQRCAMCPYRMICGT